MTFIGSVNWEIYKKKYRHFSSVYFLHCTNTFVFKEWSSGTWQWQHNFPFHFFFFMLPFLTYFASRFSLIYGIIAHRAHFFPFHTVQRYHAKLSSTVKLKRKCELCLKEKGGGVKGGLQVIRKTYASFRKAFPKIVFSQSLHQVTNFVTKMDGVEAHKNQRPARKLLL